MIILFLILIFGAVVLKNNAGISKEKLSQEDYFVVDQILIKVLVKSGDYTTKGIRITDISKIPIIIDLKIEGVDDIVKLDTEEFFIESGETKTVTLNLSSSVHGKNIEKEPDVYAGKLIVVTKYSAKEIPIIVEIESRSVPFDTNLNPTSKDRKISQGGDLGVEVRLFNLQSIDHVNVGMEYLIKDVNGNTILTESETVVVKTQSSFFKTITLPEKLFPGTYIFIAKSKAENSTGTSSYIFEVAGKTSKNIPKFNFVGVCASDFLCTMLSIIALILILAVGIYFHKAATGYVKSRKKQIKSDNHTECQIHIQNAHHALNIFDKELAKKHYLRAHKTYSLLKNHEKKELYHELVHIYNKLIKYR